MDVDRIGEDVRIGGGLIDRADDLAGTDFDDLDVPARTAQIRQIGGALAASRIPEPAGGTETQIALGDERIGEPGEIRAEQGEVLAVIACLGQRQFGGGRREMRGEDPGVARVDDGRLDGGEDLVRVVDEVGVEGVVRGDEHRHSGRARPARAPRLLPQGCAGARPTGGDRGVQARYIESELEGGGRGDGPEIARAQSLFEGAPLFGQVASAIGGDSAGQRGGVG